MVDSRSGSIPCAGEINAKNPHICLSNYIAVSRSVCEGAPPPVRTAIPQTANEKNLQLTGSADDPRLFHTLISHITVSVRFLSDRTPGPLSTGRNRRSRK